MRTLQACSTMTATLANGETPMEQQKRAPNGVATRSPALAARNGKPLTIAPRLAAASSPRLSPCLARDGRFEALQTPKGNPREDCATPAKTLLSSNITPRSGLRKARVDSASSTPNRTPTGTPGSSRPTSIITRHEKNCEEKRENHGLGLRGATTENGGAPLASSRVSTATHGGTSPQQTTHNRKSDSPEISPMFFHASDVLKDRGSKVFPQLNQVYTKAKSVVSVGGKDELGTDGSWSYTTSPTEESHPKFFYANGVPGTEPNTIPVRPTAVPTASKLHSPKQTTFSPQSGSAVLRAPSPLKEVEVSESKPRTALNSKRQVSSTSNAVLRPTEGHPATSSTTSNDIIRRASLRSATVPQVRHSKASSVSSIDSRSNRKSNSIPGIKPIVVPASSTSASAGLGNLIENQTKHQSPIWTPTGVPSSPSTPSHTPQLFSQSPSRAVPADSKLEQLNILAANARRERKVLDLEISNSSLLAINRTLEREMRKQNSELRRYRRLTSAGCISIAPSNRTTSSRFSGLTDTDFSSDLDFDIDLQAEDLETFSDDEGSSVSHSPSSARVQSARQRAKDERRLQLDLSKHQELLLDSQRMNQSLKRCLGWTEDLIKEGKRALAYQAKVSEEDIRGRVLTLEEVEGEVGRGRGLLSPALDTVEDPCEHLGDGVGVETEALGEVD